MTCFVPLILAGYTLIGPQPCNSLTEKVPIEELRSQYELTVGESTFTAGLERPFAFRETPPRPLSSSFELDTKAYIRSERLSVSLDLWRMPVAGAQRPPTGIDLWSVMLGWAF